MPIYEYRCERCGHELEALQKISDAPLTDCPACGESALKKLISAAAFRLKGGGWYETDFKKDGKKNLHESGDKPKADKSEGGTKPAAVDKKPAIEKKPAAEK
jgi:putative FmdB family regulatory protein